MSVPMMSTAKPGVWRVLRGENAGVVIQAAITPGPFYWNASDEVGHTKDAGADRRQEVGGTERQRLPWASRSPSNAPDIRGLRAPTAAGPRATPKGAA